MNGAPTRGLRAALTATTASLLGVAGLALGGASPTTCAAALAASFVPYFWMLAAADGVALEQLRPLALAAVGLVGLCFWACPPLLSDDVFRYMWDGRVAMAGIDPYRYAPSDPALHALRDDAYRHVNHPSIATLYPPLAQLLFALGDGLAHDPRTFKLIALAAHLIMAWAVPALASSEGRRSQALLAYALNPLALSETALNGHIDAVAGCGLVLAVWALRQRRVLRGALAMALATGTKLIGLLLLPWALRLGTRALLTATLLSGLALAPLLLSTRGPGPSGAQEYALRWRGNDALFGLVADGTRSVLEAAAGPEERAQGHVRLDRLAPLLNRLEGTALDPRASERARGKQVPDPADFETGFLAQLIARALVLTVAFGLALGLALSRLPLVQGVRLTIFAALLLSPQIHPWYLLWLLPFEAAAGGLAGLCWSVSVLVAYAPLDGWTVARMWREDGAAKLCEFGVVGLVFLYEARLPYRKRRISS